MRVSTPAAPPAPTPITPEMSAQANLDYLKAISSPEYQQAFLNAEQQFRPQYTALNLAELNQYLMGNEQAKGLLDIQDLATRQSAATEAATRAQLRQQDIADVEALGARATAAFRAANPQLQAALSRAESLQGGGTPAAPDYESYVRNNPDLLRNYQENVSKNTGQSMAEYGKLHYTSDGKTEGRQLPMTAAVPAQNAFGEYEKAILAGRPGSEIQPGMVSQGLLGQQMYQDAIGASGLGAVGQTLQGRAQTLAQSTGALTPDEIRALQQSTREAYAARGTEMGTGAVSAEALARLTNQRERMMQDIGIASALNAASQQELGANRAFQQGVQAQDVSRQFGNVANQMQAQEANRMFAAQQGQQNIANLGALGQMRLGQQAADRAYALNLVGMQQGIAGDPFQAILGRPSQAMGAAQFQQQYAGGLLGNQGPQLFDPNAGSNLMFQNQANQNQFATSIYGSQTALAGAQAGATGSMVGGLLSGAGALGGGYVAAAAF